MTESPSSVDPTTRTRRTPWWAVPLLTALAYLAGAWAGLLLAIPPSYASPLFPAAGVALAATLTYGWIALPGIGLAAFAVSFGVPAVTASAQPALLAAAVGLGAALQAGAGAWLVRRFATAPLRLSEPRDIAALFGLGAGLASVLSASAAVLALRAAGMLATPDVATSWLTWWAGDALGALIVTPVVLTLIGRPRDDWAPRRWTVGLPLALATLMFGSAIALVARWDRERLQSVFTREATAAVNAVEARLREPLMALEAMRGVYIASEDVTREEMRRAAAPWLAGDRLVAIGWYQRVARAGVAGFEAAVRNEGVPAYRVFDRTDAGPRAAAGDELLAMRFIEPLAPNAEALGLNAYSVPAARAAIEAGVAGDTPSASAAFLLTQHRNGPYGLGVVVYRAIGAPNAATAAERQASLRGVVFVTLQPAELIRSLQAAAPSYLGWCLADADPRAEVRRMAGTPGCEAASAQEFSLVHDLAFAGRQWQLRISARPGAMPEAREGNAWMFALTGLLGAAMLAALLLVVTGRTRRIEAAVAERTGALRAEALERERAQAALRDSEQRFRNILNNVPIGVVYTDLGGIAKQANPRFCELTGYGEDELMAMTSAQYTHPEDVSQDEALTAQLVRGELPLYRRQKRFVRKDGRVVWVQAIVSLLRDELGTPRRIVAVVEDISEHLRLEESERARERAEAANRAKSDFLSRMSHELRTPLNAMLGFAQLLELDRRQPLSPEQRPWVAQIQQAGWHLLDMINDVLDLSRIESGNLKLQIEPLNLAELLTATMSMVGGDAKTRRLTITTDLGEGTGALLGDATRVKQILTNLLSNAVKYNVDGGRIHVQARLRTPELVEVAVTDTGIGMTDAQLAELFQPFNRLGRERSAHQGTGIGLVISQRLAELMGGSLRARSIAGQGSAFILALPRAVEQDTVPSALREFDTSTAEYHRRLVHYVEDNETNVEVMRGILAQRPQVALEVSTTGAAGLAAIRRGLPDLVLLDMQLPDMSGLDIIRAMKADPATAEIPVVVVSADATELQTERALGAGARAYLTKPVSVHELLGAVDEVLEGVVTRFG